MTWEERAPDAPAMTLLKGIKTEPSPATHRQLLSTSVEAASAAMVHPAAASSFTQQTHHQQNMGSIHVQVDSAAYLTH